MDLFVTAQTKLGKFLPSPRLNIILLVLIALHDAMLRSAADALVYKRRSPSIQMYKQLGSEKYTFSFLWHFVFGGVFVSMAGSMCHFIYQWTDCNPVVGLFVAVNESTFEHAKILVLPILLFWVFDCVIFKLCYRYSFIAEYKSHSMAAAGSLCTGIFIMIAGYYVLSELLFFEHLWSDITLFVLSAFAAQFVGWVCGTYLEPTLFNVISATLVIVVIGFCHIHYTVSPPKWQFIFRDPRGFYGVPDECYYNASASNTTTRAIGN